MTPEHRLASAEALIKALESGIKIVDQTFYRDPPLSGMTKAHTEAVVQTMLVGIRLYREAIA